jgi:hypothetical protein
MSYLPYGFGGGARPFRLAGVAGVVEVGDGIGAGRGLGLGPATVGDGTADVDVVAAPRGSSIGSPIEIVDGIGLFATAGASTGNGEAVAEGVGRFGSSVETAMTAAAVRTTTNPPINPSPIRGPRLAFFGGSGGIECMLRRGARLMSSGV